MAFEIVELTGSRRSIVLRDRALPYRPVSWPVEQRNKKTVYPGNPVATIQVLGPEERDTEVEGTWKTRYIGSMVSLWGFDDLASDTEQITAEILVRAMERVLRAGNQLEVRWEGIIRRGILAAFEPQYERLQDIKWRATFIWSQVGDQEAPRATAAEDEGEALSDAQTELDDSLSEAPTILLPNIGGLAETYGDAIRSEVVAMITRIGQAIAATEVTFDDWQAVSTSADAVISQCDYLRQLVTDSNPEDMVATDDIASRLLVSTWAGDVGASVLALQAEAITARDSIRTRVGTELLDVVIAKQNQSLRDLAAEYYGSPDDWTVIADWNGLVGSNPVVGTSIYIPRRRGSAT